MNKKKLKDLTKSMMISGLALGLMAGSAFAISNVQREGNISKTTIAKEIIDPSAGFIHSAAGGIEFDIDTGISAGKYIAVSITGGKFENVDDLEIVDNTGATVISGPAVYDTNGTWAKFIVPAGGLSLDTNYMIREKGGGLSIKINPGVTSVAVTVATDDPGETNPSETNSEFYTTQQQFVMIAGNSPVGETIDVEKDLLKFVPTDTWGIKNTETTAYYDNNGVGIQAMDTNPDIKAVIYSNVGVNFEVTGEMTGINSMTLVDTKGTPQTTDDEDIATFNIDYDNNKATASMKLTDLLNKQVAIKLTVDGTTPLEDRKLSINAKLVPADEVKVATTLIDATSNTDVSVVGGFIARGKEIFNFDINGLQFVAPYVRADDYVTSVIRVENAANRDSKIWWFVNSGGEWKLIGTDDLPKGEVIVKLGSDLVTQAGGLVDGSKGFAVWGIVKTTDRWNNKNITVYGSQQIIGGPFRPLPIQVKWPDWLE